MYSELENKARSRRVAALASVESRRSHMLSDAASFSSRSATVKFQSRRTRSRSLPTLVL